MITVVEGFEDRTGTGGTDVSSDELDGALELFRQEQFEASISLMSSDELDKLTDDRHIRSFVS